MKINWVVGQQYRLRRMTASYVCQDLIFLTGEIKVRLGTPESGHVVLVSAEDGRFRQNKVNDDCDVVGVVEPLAPALCSLTSRDVARDIARDLLRTKNSVPECQPYGLEDEKIVPGAVNAVKDAPPKINWQVGKTYPMRNGEHVTLMRANQCGPNPVILTFSDGFQRGLDGRFIYTFECPIDIIGESEPKPKKETYPIPESLTKAFDKIFGDLVDGLKANAKISTVGAWVDPIKDSITATVLQVATEKRYGELEEQKAPPTLISSPTYRDLDLDLAEYAKADMLARDNKPDDRRPRVWLATEKQQRREMAQSALNYYRGFRSIKNCGKFWTTLVEMRAADKPSDKSDARPWHDKA